MVGGVMLRVRDRMVQALKIKEVDVFAPGLAAIPKLIKGHIS